MASPSGVKRVLVTYTDGQGQWQSLDLHEQGATGQWQGALSISRPISYFVQAVDSDGDVAQLTNKGSLFGIGLKASYDLGSGWNLIALALNPLVPYTAQSLLDDINGQGGQCSEVDRWLNGGWDAYPNETPFNIFAIVPKQGYFVKCSQTSVFVP